MVLTKKGIPKPIKLDGIHVQQLLTGNSWREAVNLLDFNLKIIAVWEVQSLD